MDFNELFPLKFFINLDKRTDRLQKAKEQFSWLGLDPLRMPGKIYNDPRNHPSWNGAIGCLFSHLAILRFALDMKQNVFIFEDDLLMTMPDAKTILNRASEEISDLDWQMFYAGGNILRPFHQVSEYLAKLQHCQSTISYGVKWEFIEDLIKNFENINAPIDVIYADRVIPKVNAYITIPMLFVQRDSYSDIEGQEVKYTSYLEKRYWDNLVKLPLTK